MAESERTMKYRKTYYYARTSYTYTFANGQKITFKVGDINPIDGSVITEEMIKLLHSLDDAEVNNNIKNSRPPISDSTKQEIREWEEDHPGETAPKKWNVSLDMFFGDDDSDIDCSRIMREIYDRYHYDNIVKEKVDEIIESMPKKTRTACVLVWKEGYSQKEAAEIMGCTNGNLSRLISRAEDIIRKKY